MPIGFTLSLTPLDTTIARLCLGRLPYTPFGLYLVDLSFFAHYSFSLLVFCYTVLLTHLFLCDLDSIGSAFYHLLFPSLHFITLP